MTQAASHESFSPRHEVTAASERSFGLVFAGVFAIVALAPLRSGADLRWWALAVAAGFLAAALAAPRLLAPLNRAWFRFGMALNRVMTPLIMGLLFFLTVTPIALALRAAGKDPLRLKRDPGAASYWLPRPAPVHHDMTKQF